MFPMQVCQRVIHIAFPSRESRENTFLFIGDMQRESLRKIPYDTRCGFSSLIHGRVCRIRQSNCQSNEVANPFMTLEE